MNATHMSFLVSMYRGFKIVGLHIHMSEVENVMSANDRAVNSMTVIVRPNLCRSISARMNQKVENIVI